MCLSTDWKRNSEWSKAPTIKSPIIKIVNGRNSESFELEKSFKSLLKRLKSGFSQIG